MRFDFLKPTVGGFDSMNPPDLEVGNAPMQGFP